MSGDEPWVAEFDSGTGGGSSSHVGQQPLKPVGGPFMNAPWVPTWTLRCADSWFWWIMLIGVITAVILAALALSNTSAIHEKVDLMAGYVNGTCDDGNVCTADVYQFGGCTYSPKPLGQSCNEPACMTSSGTCDLHGNCKSANCAGNCEIDDDCPDIDFVIGCDKTCAASSGICQYTCVSELDPVIDTLVGAGCEGEKDFIEHCKATLDPLDEYSGCLRTRVHCGEPSVKRDNMDLFCVHTFRCSEPQPSVLLRRDQAIEKHDPNNRKRHGRHHHLKQLQPPNVKGQVRRNPDQLQ